jgi:hypothetical protein
MEVYVARFAPFLGNLIIKRGFGLRFDSHPKEGVRINSKVALENPTHAPVAANLTRAEVLRINTSTNLHRRAFHRV